METALQSAVDLGSHREEQGVVPGEFAQLGDALRRGSEHFVGGMRAAVACLDGEERPLNVPAGDRPAKRRVGVTELFGLGQAAGHRLPVIGDEGEKNLPAARLAKLLDGVEQVGFGEVVLLKVDPSEAVDLKIEQRRADPLGLGGRLVDGGPKPACGRGCSKRGFGGGSLHVANSQPFLKCTHFLQCFNEGQEYPG